VITADAATDRPAGRSIPPYGCGSFSTGSESIVDGRMLLSPAHQPKAANAAA
jgi:hypothetical protein